MGSSQLGGAEGRNPTAVDVAARWRVFEWEIRSNCAAPTAVAGPSHGPWPEKQGHTRTGQERQGQARTGKDRQGRAAGSSWHATRWARVMGHYRSPPTTTGHHRPPQDGAGLG